MKKNSSNIAFIICFALCLVFSACGQANSTPASSAEPTPEPTPSSTPVPTPTPTPTPKVVDYEALAIQLNSDVEPSPDGAGVNTDAENTGTTEEGAANAEAGEGSGSDAAVNSAVSGGVFEAGEECVIYRFWSSGINRELIDLLGNDGTEQSTALYSELLKSFVSSYDALQKAVSLYEPDARLKLHVVENSEATAPIIVVENGGITYDYATEQGYFVASEDAGVAEEIITEEAAG